MSFSHSSRGVESSSPVMTKRNPFKQVGSPTGSTLVPRCAGPVRCMSAWYAAFWPAVSSRLAGLSVAGGDGGFCCFDLGVAFGVADLGARGI